MKHMTYMELHYDSDDKASAHVFILGKLMHLQACVNGNTLKFTCTQYLVHEQKLFKFFFLHFPDCMEPMYLFEQKSDTFASRPKKLVHTEPPVGSPPPFHVSLDEIHSTFSLPPFFVHVGKSHSSCLLSPFFSDGWSDIAECGENMSVFSGESVSLPCL